MGMAPDDGPAAAGKALHAPRMRSFYSVHCGAPSQVGELHAGAGRRSLDFSLRARPDAVIDLAGPLQAAGHSLSHRRACFADLSGSSFLASLPCQQACATIFLPLASRQLLPSECMPGVAK